MMVRGIYFIWKKEMADQLRSPFIYILAALFSLIVGWPFYNRIILARQWTTGTLLDSVMQPTFGDMISLFLFFSPLITMRCFAEEKKQHTLNLLFLSHCSHFQIIMGKFLSAMSISFFILGPTFVFPCILAFSGYSHWGLVGVSYLGILLSIACYTSVGLFTSGLTENQILSALLSFTILLGFMLVVLVGNASQNDFLAQMFSYVSIHFHLGSFLRGAVVSYSFVFYLSFVGFFIFLTERSLDSRNW